MTETVGQHWDRLSGKMVESVSLEIFEKRVHSGRNDKGYCWTLIQD